MYTQTYFKTVPRTSRKRLIVAICEAKNETTPNDRDFMYFCREIGISLVVEGATRRNMIPCASGNTGELEKN